MSESTVCPNGCGRVFGMYKGKITAKSQYDKHLKFGCKVVVSENNGD